MDDLTFQSKALPTLLECGKLLTRSSELLGQRKSIVFIELEGLYPNLVYAFHKLVRKLPPGDGVDLILHSLGGSIDAASGIASICRERFGAFRVIVPFMAKSAAALLALSADQRLMTCSAQLGPVDPQVLHPEKRIYFPAHSIKEALAQVQATRDPIVKALMADKLDPFLIGAYEDAISASKQYIQKIVDGWTTDSKSDGSAFDRDAIVIAFTEEYKSHGYPIGPSILRAIGAPYESITGEAEDVICDLHERCVDLLDEDDEQGTIILTKDEYLYRTETFRMSGKFAAVAALSAATSTPAKPVKKPSATAVPSANAPTPDKDPKTENAVAAPTV